MKLPTKSTTPFVPSSLYNELVEAVVFLLQNAIVASGPGTELLSLPHGRGIGIAHQSSDIIYAKITGSSPDGDNRYKYTWVEVVKLTNGYGGWVVRENGRVGTAENGYYARNLVEDMNAETGTLGNGVAVSSLVGTFALQPAPVDTIVQLMEVRTGEGSTEYWFSYENGIDGECEE